MEKDAKMEVSRRIEKSNSVIDEIEHEIANMAKTRARMRCDLDAWSALEGLFYQSNAVRGKPGWCVEVSGEQSFRGLLMSIAATAILGISDLNLLDPE